MCSAARIASEAALFFALSLALAGDIEVAGIPGATYDTDKGLGLALVGNVAQLEGADPEDPWAWKLEAQLYAATKDGQVGYHEHYLSFDRCGRFRWLLQLSYNQVTNARWYGLGSDSPVLGEGHTHEYARLHPSVSLDLRIPIGGSLEAYGGAALAYERITTYEGSLLAGQDLSGMDPHLAERFQVGLLRSTRDDETWPTRGSFTELALRGGHAEGTWGGANLTLRGYVPLVDRHLVLATRVLGDVMVGDVPFYLLNEFGGLYRSRGPGGLMSVRGVLDRRYAGKLKVIGNVELRSRFLYFDIKNTGFSLGAVAFVDGGQLWAPDPQLDGGPIKLGTGGGARVYVGSTFVIRVDYGWSPIDETTGFYMTIGEIF